MGWATTIADLTRQQGTDAARSAQQRGQIWASTISQLGQLAGNIPGQLDAEKDAAQRRQMGDIQLRQARQGEYDDQAVRDILATHKGDLDSALPDIMQVSPTKGMAIQKQLTEARKTGIETHKLQIETADKTYSLGTQILGSVTDQPSYEAAKKAITGLDHGIGSQMPDQYDPAVVERLKAAGTTVAELNKRKHDALTEYVDLEKLQRGTPEFADKAAKVFGGYLSGAATAQDWDQAFTSAPTLGIPPAVVALFPRAFSPQNRDLAGKLAMSPKERTDTAETAARIPLIAAQTAEATARVPLVAAQTAEAKARVPLIGAEAAKAAQEANQLRQVSAVGASGATTPDVAPGQKNDAFLQALPPQTGSLVKALADGRMQFPSGNALRSPYWQGLLQAVAKYDPSFDAVNYNARAKTRADFTSGKSSNQVNAINTVIGHLSSLSDAADALKNGNVPLLNSIANRFAQARGKSEVTNFNTIKKAVSDEVTRVWRQAGGSVEDIRTAQQNLDASGSPEQLHGAIATYADLLSSKLGSLNEQYRQGMGTDKIDILTPQAQAALAKLGQRAGHAPADTTPASFRVGPYDVKVK